MYQNPPEPMPHLARNLHRRYFFVVVAIAALVILDQAVVQPALIRLNFYAPVINVAGRQRMLSQKVTKAALAIQASENQSERQLYMDELALAVELWSESHHDLQRGNPELSLPGTDSPSIQKAFVELQPHFEAIRSAAKQMIEHDSNHDHQFVRVILEHESHYLPIMDAIVGMFESEARDQTAWLRLSGLVIAIVIVALLIVVWFLILWPAARLLERAHHQLEDRVAERTQQLQAEMAERRTAELRSRQLLGQLAHAARLNAMGQLATGLAHEINQPLAAITNYAEGCCAILEHGNPSETRLADGLAGISQSALRAGQIVRQMRDFVQSKPSERKTIDINDLVHEVAHLLEAEARKFSSRLELRLATGLPPVPADPIQIQQVLVNLIQNSLQAMRHDPPEGRAVTIETISDSQSVTVTVSDTGPGFSDIATLFEPFVTTKPDGLGMGLAISRTIIQQHGRELTAESGLDRGAVVRFKLPIAGADA